MLKFVQIYFKMYIIFVYINIHINLLKCSLLNEISSINLLDSLKASSFILKSDKYYFYFRELLINKKYILIKCILNEIYWKYYMNILVKNIIFWKSVASDIIRFGIGEKVNYLWLFHNLYHNNQLEFTI